MKREFPKRKNHMILFSKIIDYSGYSGKVKRKGDFIMEHIMQIAISVEDEKIVKKVEETAENQIIQILTDRVEDVISEKYGWCRNNRDYTPLKNMVSEQIQKILSENKDLILSEAGKILANKLARSKAGKEILQGLKESQG